MTRYRITIEYESSDGDEAEMRFADSLRDVMPDEATLTLTAPFPAVAGGAGRVLTADDAA